MSYMQYIQKAFKEIANSSQTIIQAIQQGQTDIAINMLSFLYGYADQQSIFLAKTNQIQLNVGVNEI